MRFDHLDGMREGWAAPTGANDASRVCGRGPDSGGMNFLVIYERTGTGYSCYAGNDLAETKALMERAIEMHLEGMREDGDAIPAPTTAAEYIEVLAR